MDAASKGAEPEFNPKSLHVNPEIPSYHKRSPPASPPPDMDVEAQRRVRSRQVHEKVGVRDSRS